MSEFKVLPLRLTKGAELKQSLLDFASQNGLSAPFVLTCCGSVSSATLRFATPKCGGKENVQEFKEYFEICSLVGTLANSGHLHVVLGREDGTTLSGHVVGNMIIHTTAEIVIGNCEMFKFERCMDDSTGFKELKIIKEEEC